LKLSYGIKTVWINCDIDILIKRDPKRLYGRALLPEDHPEKLNNLTGINDSYDIPIDHDLVINTHTETAEQPGNLLCDFILRNIGH
jgi:adenylylsulfate kinase